MYLVFSSDITCPYTDLENRLRRKLGKLAIIFAVLSIIWLALGMFNFVPLILMIPGETLIRSHATLPVLCLLLASWAFWNDD